MLEKDDYGSSGMIKADNMIAAIKRGYAIKRDGATLGYCSIGKYNRLVYDIQELTAQRINSFLSEVTSNDNE